MNVIAAYMLATLGGNTDPFVDDLKKILESVGAKVDEHKIQSLLSHVSGKNIIELIAYGKEKLASLPSGNVASAAPPPAVAEETKGEFEEKVEEEEEEDDEPMFPLFDSKKEGSH